MNPDNKDGDIPFDVFQATAEVLAEKVDTIRDEAANSFIELGGDSVRAAMLSFEAENAGINLTVQDVLEAGSLTDLKDQVSTTPGTPAEKDVSEAEAAPFSLLGEERDSISREATEMIADNSKEISDVLPCTSQQSRLFLGSIREPGSYVSQWQFSLPQGIDVERFRKACEDVYHQTQLLRTRIFQASNGQCYQIVLNEKLVWDDSVQAHQHSSEPSLTVENGSVLTRFRIITIEEDPSTFEFVAHHALYDRWSFNLIVSDICHAYDEQSEPLLRPPFSRYLNYGDQSEAKNHYQKYLGGSSSNHFPVLPSPTYRSRASSFQSLSYKLPSAFNGSMAALVTTAWSLLISTYADSQDALFGFTTWGRDTSVTGVLEMAAPTFNTVPLRIGVDDDDSLAVLLKQVEEQLVQLTRVQRFGTDDISKISRDCRNACQFQNVLVVQPKPKSNDDQSSILKHDNCKRILPQQAHPLVLEATVFTDGFEFAWSHDPNIISEEACLLMHQHLSNTLNSLVQVPELKLTEFSMAGKQDIETLIAWNSKKENWASSTLDEFVASGARNHPDHPAIVSRQGSLTYAQLHEKSAQLARHLSEVYEVNADETVALLLERGIQAIVSMISVLMCGAGYIPLDHKNPAKRVQQVVKDSHSKVVICASSTKDKVSELDCRIIDLDQEMEKVQNYDGSPDLSKAQPDHTAYIIYTSGSTGTPKGVVVRHSAMSESVRALAQRWNIRHESHVYHGSSIAFDASVLEIYCTLSVGGTICVASEQDKFVASDFMKDLGVTIAAMTPSESIVLEPESLPDLETLILWAEPLPVAEMKRWTSAKHLIQGYGPTECCGVCVTDSMSAGSHPQRLGRAAGGITWIVSPQNPDILAPIGTVGELVISGKTLAEGYYGQQELTESVFKERLAWMDKFSEQLHDRAYLTGDLVKYNMDGSIQFVRRKAGGYVKIAGNRVDLGETSYHLSSQGLLQSLFIVLTQAFGDHETSLICCFAVDKEDTKECKLLSLTDETRALCQEARQALMSSIPSYMVPTVFVPISDFPKTDGGKIDQNLVKAMLEDLDPGEALKQYTVRDDDKHKSGGVDDSNLTETEKLTRKLWSQVVDVEEPQLGRGSHFFACGGSSAMAFRLVAAARKQGYVLRVSDVYNHPTLSDMSTRLQSSKAQNDQALANFALLPAQHKDNIKQELAQQLSVDAEDIEDAYPCSAYQRWMIDFSSKLTGAYVRHHLFELSSSVDLDLIREFCHTLTVQNPTLRTRVTRIGGEIYQSVIRSPSKCETFKEPPETFMRNHDADFDFNKNLSRFVILEDRDQRWLVWSIHHSRYDGYSLGLLFDRLASILSSKQHDKAAKAEDKDTTRDRFPEFIQYLQSTDSEAARSYWRTYLSDFENASNGIISKGYNYLTNNKCSREFNVSLFNSKFSPGTVLRTAFAMTLSSHTATQDVVFGTTVPGRDLPIDKIEHMTGQTMLRLPIRITLDQEQDLTALLKRVESDFAKGITHQKLQFDQIQSLNDSCQRACDYAAHFIVQNDEDPDTEADRTLRESGWNQVETDTSMPYPYPLFVECTPRDNSVLVEVKFSSENFEAEFVERLISDLEEVTKRLVEKSEDGACVGDVRSGAH